LPVLVIGMVDAIAGMEKPQYRLATINAATPAGEGRIVAEMRRNAARFACMLPSDLFRSIASCSIRPLT
jgi:hypothetical protein